MQPHHLSQRNAPSQSEDNMSTSAWCDRLQTSHHLSVGNRIHAGCVSVRSHNIEEYGGNTANVQAANMSYYTAACKGG